MWMAMLTLIVFGMTIHCASPLVDSLSIQYMNHGVKMNYAISRACGSLCWAVFCVVVGLIADAFGANRILIFQIVVSFLFAFFAFNMDAVDFSKERKKEGPRLGHKGRADAKASRQLLLLCIPAIIGYILFNYIPMGAAVIIPFKNYKFSKGILGSAWCGLANFKWIIQSVALDRALRNTVLYGLLFMVLSPVTNVIIALLLFEITSRRRLKTYQTIITFPNFMSMVIVGYIVYAILSPRTGLMNQIIQFFGGDPVDVYMNPKYWPFILTVVNLWKGIGMGSMMYFAALMGIDTSLYEAAEIDGAGRFQKMLHISLPHLVPLICIFTIMNAGSLISGNFDLFYVIPRNTSTLYATTDILNTYVYRSLQESSYAIGATTGLIQSVVGMFLVLLSNWIVKKISPDNSMF